MRTINDLHLDSEVFRGSEMHTVMASIFVFFMVTVFLIPDSIPFAESLCFAYTFGIIQAMEVVLMKGNTLCVTIGFVFACILPATQFLLVMGGVYSESTDHSYVEVYMLKELFMYLFHRFHRKSISHRVVMDTTVCVLMGMWVLIDVLIWMNYLQMVETATIMKLANIVRFSPVFLMALVNV